MGCRSYSRLRSNVPILLKLPFIIDYKSTAQAQAQALEQIIKAVQQRRWSTMCPLSYFHFLGHFHGFSNMFGDEYSTIGDFIIRCCIDQICAITKQFLIPYYHSYKNIFIIYIRYLYYTFYNYLHYDGRTYVPLFLAMPI